jgi:glutamate-1-semialdehyde 2,1-aminomutase
VERYESGYRKRTPNSARLFNIAKKSLPGGVSANNKALNPYPLYVSDGRGAYIVDIDGNSYIDLLMGAGPLILGHRPPKVIDALRNCLERGVLFILPTELEVELAQRIKKHASFVELIRFTNTGSEATLMALRVARLFTGRRRIAKFDGHFHGHANDTLSVHTGITSPEALERAAGSDWGGIPEHVTADVLLLPNDNAHRAVELISMHANELAAVIMEPVPFAFALPPSTGFLRSIRDACSANDVLLIFDEVITGFRLGLGGGAEYFGVTPDLVTFGKIIGGGLPLGVFGGRGDIMEATLSPANGPGSSPRRVFQSGTFTANPLALAAGIATLDELESDTGIYSSLAELGDQLRNGLRSIFEDADFAARVTGLESIVHLHFLDREVRTLEDLCRSDQKRNREFCFSLMESGVFWRVAHGAFLSTAHTSEDIDRVLEAARKFILFERSKSAAQREGRKVARRPSTIRHRANERGR